MNKTSRNFRIDILLFLLLGLDIALIGLSRRAPADIHPGLGWHAHAFISILLTLGCLIHTALHWRWFAAVLTGKAKGKVKLIMNCLVVIATLLANLSGHTVLASQAAGALHSWTGACALLGMFVHGVKHTRWMVMTTRRLADSQPALRQPGSSN